MEGCTLSVVQQIKGEVGVQYFYDSAGVLVGMSWSNGYTEASGACGERCYGGLLTTCTICGGSPADDFCS